MVKPEARFGTVEVTADGEGLVSHAGVALLVELADRVGLTAALSDALAADAGAPLGARSRAGAAGLAVMLADGGDWVTDIDAYRGQERLFGARASETTTHRVLKSIDRAAAGPGACGQSGGAGAGVGRRRSPGDDHVEHRRDPC